MVDAPARMVTHCDTLKYVCVTAELDEQQWFTPLVTQVTQMCNEVPNAHTCGRVLAEVRHPASCVTPNWKHKEHTQ